MIWSILIATIARRKEQFEYLKTKLENQIFNLNLQNEIEIVSICDNCEMIIGKKRNELINKSNGKYICFIDDDDDISDDYIRLIYNSLLQNPDCISLKGIITTNGLNAKYFIHSVKYNRYFEENRIYFRPPNHLNVIKRNIAIKYPFKEIKCGEDTDYAMRMANDNVLKKEIEINNVLYFYKFINRK